MHICCVFCALWWYDIARIISSQKIYGLYGLKHHIVEISGYVTRAPVGAKQIWPHISPDTSSLKVKWTKRKESVIMVSFLAGKNIIPSDSINWPLASFCSSFSLQLCLAQPILGGESSQQRPLSSDWLPGRTSTNHVLPFCLQETGTYLRASPGCPELRRRSCLGDPELPGAASSPTIVYLPKTSSNVKSTENHLNV